MALLNLFRVLTIALALLCTLKAQAQDNSFISLCYHEVESDATPVLSRTAVHASDLAAQFAWLRAHDYHPVSLQQIINARQGGASLPVRAVLLTFDDGKKDVYTRAFPLLKLFHYPAVIALVGSWLEVPPGQPVDYDGQAESRDHFVSWDEVRQMQRSGLIEIASHTFDLHRGVVANPQGNTQPSATTRIYADGQYETDQQYLARIQKDTQYNHDLILQKVGQPPRALVWPYGRSNLAIQRVAAASGFPVTLTLIDGINTADTPLSQLKRHLIELSPSLQSFAEALRQTWNPDPARSVLIEPGRWPNIETGLSQTLDQLQQLSVNISFVDPRYTEEPAETILFRSSRLATSHDELNRIAWQIERRGGSATFISIPAAWLNDEQLLGDLARYVNFAGVRLPIAPDDPRAKKISATLAEWRWPLRIAYAPGDLDAPISSPNFNSDDLLIVPAEKLHSWAVALTRSNQILVEFGPAKSAAVALQMRALEADGQRQFGLAGFPDANVSQSADKGFDPVWRVLSLRSQPLLP